MKRILIAPIRAAATGVLYPAELFLRKACRTTVRPCFIIGAPRSGTTLFFEALVTRYNFAYFSNFAHRLPYTPVAATMIARNAIARRTSSFSSKYGHVAGWVAPNEGGWIWNRWIPERCHLTEHDLHGRRVGEMQSTVSGVATALRSPFVSKNVMHSVHMRLLDAAFPGCKFIHIVRNKVDNIRSLVRLRESGARLRPPENWVSVKPLGWERYAYEHYVIQCSAQAFLTDRNIELDREIIGKDRVFQVKYEEFCRDPNHAMDNLRDFLITGGIVVQERIKLPNSFVISTGHRLPNGYEQLIEQFVVEHTSLPGLEGK
ncbi:MAG: sulfotransferase [Candidatus Hydrogenedentes bacterium]|nr:sulfotransferase [Candidatus Hydrogenedentota bacterium]